MQMSAPHTGDTNATIAVESFVQKTLPPQPANAEFEEDPPRALSGHNMARTAFQIAASEAERLEEQIAEIEREIEQGLVGAKGRLAPIQKAQIVATFEMAKLVHDQQVPAQVVDEYIRGAGVKRHENEKVPFSALMRAVVTSAEIKGAPKNQRKIARASTYASAIDFVISEGMTKEEFEAELDQPRKRGEQHGIEHLAASGRKMRNATNKEVKVKSDADKVSAFLEAQTRFKISGIVGKCKLGPHLMHIEISKDKKGKVDVRGVVLDVDKALTHRVLLACAKSEEAE
jgi:hypothetical protein